MLAYENRQRTRVKREQLPLTERHADDLAVVASRSVDLLKRLPTV